MTSGTAKWTGEGTWTKGGATKPLCFYYYDPAQEAGLPIMGLLVHIAMRTPITLDFLCAWIRP